MEHASMVIAGNSEFKERDVVTRGLKVRTHYSNWLRSGS